MKKISRSSRFALTLGVLALLGACKESYEAGLEPRPNGAPGKSLDQVYLREFRVSEADYFAALNEFYVFSLSQRGSVRVAECFNDVLRLSIGEKTSPCIVMYSTIGAPTKVHLSFNVVDRVLSGPGQDSFIYQVGIYVKSNYDPALQVAPAFVANVEKTLLSYDRDRAASAAKSN